MVDRIRLGGTNFHTGEACCYLGLAVYLNRTFKVCMVHLVLKCVEKVLEYVFEAFDGHSPGAEGWMYCGLPIG